MFLEKLSNIVRSIPKNIGAKTNIKISGRSIDLEICKFKNTNCLKVQSATDSKLMFYISLTSGQILDNFLSRNNKNSQEKALTPQEARQIKSFQTIIMNSDFPRQKILSDLKNKVKKPVKISGVVKSASKKIQPSNNFPRTNDATYLEPLASKKAQLSSYENNREIRPFNNLRNERKKPLDSSNNEGIKPLNLTNEDLLKLKERQSKIQSLYKSRNDAKKYYPSPPESRPTTPQKEPQNPNLHKTLRVKTSAESLSPQVIKAQDKAKQRIREYNAKIDLANKRSPAPLHPSKQFQPFPERKPRAQTPPGKYKILGDSLRKAALGKGFKNNTTHKTPINSH